MKIISKWIFYYEFMKCKKKKNDKWKNWFMENEEKNPAKS